MKNYYKKTLCILSAVLINAFAFAQEYSNGILVLNEGLIGSNTSTVSYIDAEGTLQNDIYGAQNPGMQLGDTGQGLGFDGDFAYVVLNNSNEVKVVNKATFQFVESITDQIVYPRYIAFSNGKGYVTNWGDPGNTTDDYVAVIDLATNTVTSTIPVTEGPEEIVEKDGKLFVAHQGGYGFGNSISVIDAATSTVETIPVGDLPSALKVDNNFLYVLCSGAPFYAPTETAGILYKIDLTNYDNQTVYNFSGLEHPEFLGLDATNLYYTLNANIYKMDLTANVLPTESFINTASQNIQIPYGFNKLDDKLYFSDAVDYVSGGKVFVYGDDGSFITDYTVGPLPNGFYKAGSILSVDETVFANISVFPNPASGSFNINLSQDATVQLFDMSGRLVKDLNYTNKQPISLVGVNPGLYVVSIKTNGTSTTKKLIVR